VTHAIPEVGQQGVALFHQWAMADNITIGKHNFYVFHAFSIAHRGGCICEPCTELYHWPYVDIQDSTCMTGHIVTNI
jgi:hypothetical protein